MALMPFFPILEQCPHKFGMGKYVKLEVYTPIKYPLIPHASVSIFKVEVQKIAIDAKQ